MTAALNTLKKFFGFKSADYSQLPSKPEKSPLVAPDDIAFRQIPSKVQSSTRITNGVMLTGMGIILTGMMAFLAIVALPAIPVFAILGLGGVAAAGIGIYEVIRGGSEYLQAMHYEKAHPTTYKQEERYQARVNEAVRNIAAHTINKLIRQNAYLPYKTHDIICQELVQTIHLHHHQQQPISKLTEQQKLRLTPGAIQTLADLIANRLAANHDRLVTPEAIRKNIQESLQTAQAKQLLHLPATPAQQPRQPEYNHVQQYMEERSQASQCIAAAH